LEFVVGIGTCAVGTGLEVQSTDVGEGNLELLSTYTLRGIGRHETLWLFESTLD